MLNRELATPRFEGCAFFTIIIIINIIPPKNNPRPNNKHIVLNGCPILVVHAKAFKIQPEIIISIEIPIFSFLDVLVFLIISLRVIHIKFYILYPQVLS